MQPLEQLHAEARLQRLHLLPDGCGRYVQFVRGELEAEMPRGGLEGTKRIQWGEGIGHRGGDFDTDRARPCNRFSCAEPQQ
jgi:hypothetical protein